MKPKDVADDSFVEYVEESNKKDPKFKVGDNVRISKYKNIFTKGYTQNWSEEVFVVDKVKNTVPWTYLISDLNDKEIMGSFYEKELQKTDKKEFRIEKVIKRKGDKLYVKWKGYDSSVNSWIDKKDLVLMSDKYFPSYITAKNETVTKKEFKNLTGNVNTSDFALKANVANIKSRFVDKINTIDKLQRKNYVEDIYLWFEPEPRYLETSSTVATNISSWKSMGLSEKIKSSAETYSPALPLDG